MVLHPHEIPLVQGDQSRPATVNNCVDVLLHLEKVIDNVFSSITTRLEEASAQLQDLKQRAANAQAKVDKLTGATKATQIFSSAQYPGKEEYKPYSMVHNDRDPIPFIATPVTTKDDINMQSSMEEKLHFYHVRDRGSRKTGEDGVEEEGLGRLPPHLSSVSSLLLFNTTHNPYKKYMVLDPLGVVSGTRGEGRSHSDAASSTRLLQDAPTTLQTGDEGGLVSKDGYQYLPDLADLPDLDLPMELPSLPGVANDLLYDADIGPAIAPSVALPELPTPDLPSFTLDTPDVTPPPPPAPSQAPPPPPPAPSAPPPPPTAPHPHPLLLPPPLLLPHLHLLPHLPLLPLLHLHLLQLLK